MILFKSSEYRFDPSRLVGQNVIYIGELVTGGGVVQSVDAINVTVRWNYVVDGKGTKVATDGHDREVVPAWSFFDVSSRYYVRCTSSDKHPIRTEEKGE